MAHRAVTVRVLKTLREAFPSGLRASEVAAASWTGRNRTDDSLDELEALGLAHRTGPVWRATAPPHGTAYVAWMRAAGPDVRNGRRNAEEAPL